MIRLHPIPEAKYVCPHCQERLKVKGWYIPGMRNLADLKCSQCGREFYGDLPAGHGLYYPMLLERPTGIVHDEYGVTWFAKWLRDSYANRTDSPIGFEVEDFRPLKQPVFLNCLDTLYGHCLLKLLNAQYYLDHRPDLDLIVLVPRFLRWMVPDGVSAIWIVDLPLKRGIEWNDWLAAEIKRRIESLDACWLSVAFSHPHPEDFDIERFTKVRPFPIEEWDARLGRPTITFVWRQDRIWWNLDRYRSWRGLTRRMKRRLLRLSSAQIQLDAQRQRVITLAQTLRQASPGIDFAVAGLGHPGGLSDWIADLRTMEINEHTERAWCKRYAQSHVAVGIHGSNMLLPSAHAGAVVELVPPERWGNLIQEILVAAQDVREVMCRYRFLPLDTPATVVAKVTTSLLRYLPSALVKFKRPWCGHEALQSNPWLIVERLREIEERSGRLMR